MDGIFVPPSLSQETAALSIAASLAKLIDPKTRAEVEESVKAHHALNEAEAKKHAEALATIKKNSDILSEGKKISDKNKKDAEELENNKKEFDLQMRAGLAELAKKKADSDAVLEEAKKLREEANATLAQAQAKENQLLLDKAQHEENVKALGVEKDKAASDKASAAALKKAAQELLDGIRAKQEELKKFNF